MESLPLADTYTYTFASIGTVLMDMFDRTGETPSDVVSPIPRSPLSTASSDIDAQIVTPEDTPYSPAQSLPSIDGPSLGSLDALQNLSLYQCSSSKPPRSLLGGGGLYALIGARVWLPPSELRTIVDRAPRTTGDVLIASDLDDRRGSSSSFPDVRDGRRFDVTAKDDEDFPLSLECQLQYFGSEMWVYNRAPGLRFPRAHIAYNGDSRTYQHIVKPAMRTGADLADGPLAGAAYLHISPPYSPSDLLQLLSEFEEVGSPWRPKFVYEPAPISCSPAERDHFERAAQLVDVLSPNHEELLAFYGVQAPEEECGVRRAVEDAVEHLLNLGVGPGGAGVAVIRCGPHGACVGTRAGGIHWTPAYWANDSPRVKDVTGAGNSFIGGLVAGLKLTNGNPYEATLYGAVSASFTVEQFGLPTLSGSPASSPFAAPFDAAHQSMLPCSVQNASHAMSLRVATGREMWNSDVPQRRLELLRMRAAVYA